MSYKPIIESSRVNIEARTDWTFVFENAHGEMSLDVFDIWREVQGSAAPRVK